MRIYQSAEPVRCWQTGPASTLTIDRVMTMGILNATPDSFSDGGRWCTPRAAFLHAKQLYEDGADIIDIGCQSTRPGFTPVSADEELSRLKAVLPAIIDALPAGFPLSIDTFCPDVARYALSHGISIINDVTGLEDIRIRRLIAETGCGAVLMHCGDVTSSDDVFEPICAFFEQRIRLCHSEGIAPEQLILDCGIGFGKTREQELELLHNMSLCRVCDRPILAAASRKRVVRRYYCNDYDSPSELELDKATYDAHLNAVSSGAQMVRVHTV